jgi:hypothetical protein
MDMAEKMQILGGGHQPRRPLSHPLSEAADTDNEITDLLEPDFWPLRAANVGPHFTTEVWLKTYRLDPLEIADF